MNLVSEYNKNVLFNDEFLTYDDKIIYYKTIKYVEIEVKIFKKNKFEMEYDVIKLKLNNSFFKFSFLVLASQADWSKVFLEGKTLSLKEDIMIIDLNQMVINRSRV